MYRYYMFNKPRGYITARRDDRHRTVMELFPEEDRFVLHPLGRLDMDTEGLMIVTDDGRLDMIVMNPQGHIAKKYYFWAIGEADEVKRIQLEAGVDIGYGKLTEPARAEFGSACRMEDICHLLGERYRERLMRNPTVPVFEGYLTITEGKKHQVKRMLKAVGCCVVYLKRVSIGNLTLDEGLAPGEYRPLSREELEELCRM